MIRAAHGHDTVKSGISVPSFECSLIFSWLVFYTTTGRCADNLMDISIITPKSVTRNEVRNILISLSYGNQLRVYSFIRTVLGKSHQNPQKQHKAPVLWHRIAVKVSLDTLIPLRIPSPTHALSLHLPHTVINQDFNRPGAASYNQCLQFCSKSTYKYFIEQTMLLSHLIANKIIFSPKQIQ